jgi:hypothetical protein
MSVVRRVLVSLPADQWLTPQQNELKWGIVHKIGELGYLPEIFTNPKGMPGLAASKAWSAENLDAVGHLARFVVEVIEGLDLRAFIGSYRRSGSAS